MRVGQIRNSSHSSRRACLVLLYGKLWQRAQRAQSCRRAVVAGGSGLLAGWQHTFWHGHTNRNPEPRPAPEELPPYLPAVAQFCSRFRISPCFSPENALSLGASGVQRCVQRGPSPVVHRCCARLVPVEAPHRRANDSPHRRSHPPATSSLRALALVLLSLEFHISQASTTG